MPGIPDLSGHRILVLEDSYYLASDLARALRAAEATVMGPFPAEEMALAALAVETPACGILDINLGAGPSFAVPEALAASGVPFLFVTGHGDAVIPPAFAGVARFQKPVDLRAVIGRVATLLGGRRPGPAARENRAPATWPWPAE
jgi:DNA-binding response OmpR family regulator